MTATFATAPLSTLLRYSKASTYFSVRVLHTLVWPKLDVVIRLGLAQAYLVSGVMKATHWSATLASVSHAFPVRFMTPDTAAVGGLSIELLGGLLLAVGFMTRYAALALLGLSVATLVGTGATDSQLCCAALFGWYVIHGAGPFSVDSVLRQGLADSALPLIPRILAVSQWIRDDFTTLYLSFMRAWLALALLMAALPTSTRLGEPLPTLLQWLPWELAAYLPIATGWIGGLLLLGIGTRYIAGLMIAITLAKAMMDPRRADTVYLLVMSALFLVQGAGRLSLDQLAYRWVGRLLPTLLRDPRQLLRVRPDFSSQEVPNVFAIGDTASISGSNGHPVPGLAPAAKQAGAYVGRVIRAKVEGRASPSDFRYRHRGNLATIGRQAAVVEFGAFRLWGAPAWWLWGIVHVVFIRPREANRLHWSGNIRPASTVLCMS